MNTPLPASAAAACFGLSLSNGTGRDYPVEFDLTRL